MMKKITLTIFLLLCVTTFASASMRVVPTSYASIQSAINSCINGDTVLVMPGTYYENINFRGKKIVVTSMFYQNNAVSYISSTIINGSTPVYPDTGSCVVFHTGEDSTTVLQGFTITGGTGTKWLDIHGAGVYREGGGVLIELCSPVVKNNIIINNFVMNTTGVTSTGGGGLRIGDSKAIVLNNIVMNNTGHYGAGIVLNYSGGTFRNNIICFNSQSDSYNAGSAFWSYGSLTDATKVIENNTIIHNSAAAGTGGVLCQQTNFVIRNNIIWGNTSPGNTQILLSGGSVAVTYNDVQNGYTGAGNISAYPIFADTNYILANTSPCIDAGDSSTVYNDLEDSGNPGYGKFPAKGTIRNDMGAYGGPGSLLLSNSTVINVNNNNNNIPESFRLDQNFPNPFNPNTIIRFNIKNSRFISLKVYDILGKEVQTLVNDRKDAGTYEVNFNGNNLSSGVYIYALYLDGIRFDSKRLLLVK